MRAATLCTGTELTRGELRDSNGAWLADRLTTLGFEVVEQATVPDDRARIAAAVTRLSAAVRVVVGTGGLGPTSDDLTAEAVAEALGVGLERHAPTLARIEARYRRLGRPMPTPNVKQADVPAGAHVLDNDVGTAPGFAVSLGEARAFFLPGVPSEMHHLFETHVAPELAKIVRPTRHQAHVRSFGLRESEVAERLTDLALPVGVTIGYRASFPEIEVKVLAEARDAAEARTIAESLAVEVRRRLGPSAYGSKDDTYPAHVGARLRARGLKLAVAESCTGGLLGALLTDAPGSSDFFVFDAVTYANEAKRDLLGVDATLLDRHGAVSEEVARAMAEGALARANADVAVAVTGIAGPSGGTPEKPVGTVWMAVARRGSATRTERHAFTGDRARIRTLAAYSALSLVAAAAGDSLDAREIRDVHDGQRSRRSDHDTKGDHHDGD